ncbi:unnamed protein product, partial [Meganyctiphanes norvegica]
ADICVALVTESSFIERAPGRPYWDDSCSWSDFRALCQSPCSPHCDHGVCISKNKCECEEYWMGNLCNDYVCPNGCGGSNGQCTGPNSCTCNTGYTGASCESYDCSGDCGGIIRGRCTEPN